MITVGGVLVKGHRKLNVLSNQIPEYDPDGDADTLSDVARISSNFSKSYSTQAVLYAEKFL